MSAASEKGAVGTKKMLYECEKLCWDKSFMSIMVEVGCSMKRQLHNQRLRQQSECEQTTIPNKKEISAFISTSFIVQKIEQTPQGSYPHVRFPAEDFNLTSQL